MIRLSVTAAETALAAAEAAAEPAAAALNAERTPLHSKDVPKSFTDAAQATRADCDRRDRAAVTPSRRWPKRRPTSAGN